jgi:hypothetical protein
MKKLITLFIFSILLLQLGSAQKKIDHWEYLFDPMMANKYITGPAAPDSNWMKFDYQPTSQWQSGINIIGKSQYFTGCTECKNINSVSAFYTRTEFTIVDSLAIEAMNLYLLYMDGFVAYINGVEVARSNMGKPGSATSVGQYADAAVNLIDVSNETYSGFYIPRNLVSKSLKTGKNILAIEMHNDKTDTLNVWYYCILTAAINNTTINYSINNPQYPLPVEGDSSLLPIVMLDVPSKIIPSNARVNATMKILDNGKLNRITDNNFKYSGNITIERKSLTNQSFPKNSYGFTTIGTDGNEIGVKLLDMPAQSEWVLQGEFADRSILRDYITGQLIQEMGNYAPRRRFCELYFNNKNLGLFMLTEKIKCDSMRVNISKITKSDIGGIDVTGGYILKLDKATGTVPNAFSSKYTCPFQSTKPLFQIEYPTSANIVPEQLSYIQDYINNFESILRSPNYKDPEVGYRSYISVKSFIDYMIIQELGRNFNGYRLSTYMYKEKDNADKKGLLFMGPAWDFSLAYGYSGTLCNSNWKKEGWAYSYNKECSGDAYYVPFWWDRLLQDPYFRNELKARWEELRNGPLNQDSINNSIENFVATNRDAIDRNFLIWSDVFRSNYYPYNKVLNNYKGEIDNLKDFIKNRFSWIDDNIPEEHAEIIYTAIPGVTVNISQLVSYPNPFSDKITIEFVTEANHNVTVSVVNTDGKVLNKVNTVSNEGINRILLNNRDISGNILKPGVYFFTFELDGNLISRSKIMKN